MTARMTRKCIKVGRAKGVTLPTNWCRYYGDRIKTMTMFEDGVLIIAPQGLEDVAARMIETVNNHKNNGKEV